MVEPFPGVASGTHNDTPFIGRTRLTKSTESWFAKAVHKRQGFCGCGWQVLVCTFVHRLVIERLSLVPLFSVGSVCSW